MSIIQKAVESRTAQRTETKSVEAPANVIRAPHQKPTIVAPFMTLVHNGFLQFEPGDPASRAEMRHLKRSILQCAFGPLADPGANVLMITSAMPGSGKTFLSANLAQTLAMEKDRTTLLVDADDTRATLTRALELHGATGLFNVLHDPGISVEACQYRTDVPGLDFIPAGGRYDDALELLTSNRARDVVRQLAEENRNRLVVIDCPPLLGTPNAVAMSAMAGQILVVVEAGETSKQIIDQALELLNRDKPIGLVLNKIPRTPVLGLANGSYYSYTGPDGD